MPSEQDKSREQKAAESEVESFRKDLGPFVVAADALTAHCVPFVFVTGYAKDRLLDGYRSFPVLQKPFHRAELTDMLAKLLTPQKLGVESVIAAVAKTSP